jgi:hypothetical protein
MRVRVVKSSRPEKKWMAVFENGRVVHFGATGYQDYTQHKDSARRERYSSRHPAGPGKRENHGKSGVYTAGFWAMNLLWNKPSLQASARDMERRFGLKITLGGSRSSSQAKLRRTSSKMRHSGRRA